MHWAGSARAVAAPPCTPSRTGSGGPGGSFHGGAWFAAAAADALDRAERDGRPIDALGYAGAGSLALAADTALDALLSPLAGEVVAYTPKKVGRSVDLNKSAATIESGKWVGPVKTPVAGEVAAINDAATANPKRMNADT